jgi:hypothetical protein
VGEVWVAGSGSCASSAGTHALWMVGFGEVRYEIGGKNSDEKSFLSFSCQQPPKSILLARTQGQQAFPMSGA